MKKFISAILCVLLICSMPVYSALAAKSSVSKPTITVTSGVNKAKITIKKVSGAKKYQIFMKKGSTGTWKKIKMTTSRYYTKNSLDGGSKYYFKAKVIDKNGNKSAYSAVKSVTVKQKSSGSSNSYTVYITDTGTKYHNAGCSSLSKSCYGISLSNAKSSGYTPCARCH